uniref:Uncharacterized protein n=1 Tax=uncultured Nocardioidaceae bacterium TaxID=253824 RepID=A0A6J4MBY5_9ACTN|nr:MAG: hypothetical protein AVDCRST_MAG46-2803 [uncultured Nocardioidaceae bacterium]
MVVSFLRSGVVGMQGPADAGAARPDGQIDQKSIITGANVAVGRWPRTGFPLFHRQRRRSGSARLSVGMCLDVVHLDIKRYLTEHGARR